MDPRNLREGICVISPIAQVERALRPNNGTVEMHG
jgi:hypothetical protein